MTTAQLIRPRLRLIGGVCAGFAAHTGLPVAAVRTVAVLLAACGGAGLLLYGWLWATTPTDAAPEQPLPKRVLLEPSVAFVPSSAQSQSQSQSQSVPAGAQPQPAQGAGLLETVTSMRSAPITEILLGLALLSAGVAFVANQLGAGLPLEIVIPAIVVLAGVALAWRQFADIRSGTSGGRSALLVRALGALVLVALGILLFFVTSSSPNVWTVVFAALSVLVGVGLVVAPWLLRLSNDLAEERAARGREAERAELAAHLHDSVLQTLALIQQKAGPHSDAARLARAQERELREWLFTGATADGVDLAGELRALAAALEAEYSVHVEIVAVGTPPEGLPDGLLAAAREALLNAARHAGGTISVYLESAPERVQLSITDRGPGFELSAVPDDRYGVRESILGRMQRIGGSAELRPGPGGAGTEVRLTLQLAPRP